MIITFDNKDDYAIWQQTLAINDGNTIVKHEECFGNGKVWWHLQRWQCKWWQYHGQRQRMIHKWQRMAMDGGKTIVNIIDDNDNCRDWWQQKRKLCNWQILGATKKLILQMATNNGNNKENYANGNEWWQHDGQVFEHRLRGRRSRSRSPYYNLREAFTQHFVQHDTQFNIYYHDH